MSTTNRFTPLLWACAALALMVGAVSTSLSANTLTMAEYNGSSDQVTCTPNCSGFVGDLPGPISLSLTDAYDYPKAGSPESELALLNELLVLLGRDSVSSVDKTESEGTSFSTNREYFSIKKSGLLWFFANTSGVSLDVTLDGEEYSHWTAYGAVVPVPAAFWLFGTALIGFIGFSRKTSV